MIAVVPGVVLACGSGGSTTGPAPTTGEVRALLARHGRAVMDRSAAAFLADVDGSAAARGFRDRQAAEIDDVADVPLASWTYTVTAPVTDPAVRAAAAKRYGTAVTLVRVSFGYALRGVDPVPDAHDQWLTFVRRSGHVLLAGDDDVIGAGGASWRGPWDFGPVFAVTGRATVVLGHIEVATRLGEIAAAVDAAIPVVTSVWGDGWSQHVAVVVASGPDELTALTGQGTAVSDISAVAVTGGRDASGRPFGQRLIMNPDAVEHLSAVGLRIVVQHEITHLASEPDTAATTPRWLVEGFADYVGNLGSGQSAQATAAELRAEVAAGTVPASLPADADFEAGGARLPQAYEEAWLACRLIAAQIGQDGLVRFYRAVASAVEPAAEAVAGAMTEFLHESTDAFTSQWRAYLQEQLR
jgi:hypothetical protein